MKNECLFCSIVRGDENAFKVLENENAMAILPKKMEANGHTMVIPKRHFQDIFDIPADVLKKVMDLARNVSLKFRKSMNAK